MLKRQDMQSHRGKVWPTVYIKWNIDKKDVIVLSLRIETKKLNFVGFSSLLKLMYENSWNYNSDRKGRAVL